MRVPMMVNVCEQGRIQEFIVVGAPNLMRYTTIRHYIIVVDSTVTM